MARTGRPPTIPISELPALGREMLAFFLDAYEKLHTEKKLVFFTTFAIHKGLTKYNLYDYSKKDEEYLFCYMQCKQITEEILKQGIALGYFVPGPGIFIAKNETEMRDVTDLAHGVDSGLKMLLDASLVKLKTENKVIDIGNKKR